MTDKETVEDLQAIAPNRVARGKKLHLLDCQCCVCEAAHRRAAAGKPTKAEERALRRQQRAQTRAERRRAQTQRRSSTPQNARERRLVRETALVSALAGQATTGGSPNIAQAARIAGIDPSQAHRKLKEDGSLQEALARAGINVGILDEVGKQGLYASETRLILDKRTGEVRDKVEFPDHHARHKFWRDYNMMIGRLGKDEPSGGSGPGLVILTEKIELTPGHPSNCNCESCCAAWSAKASAALAQRKLPPPLDGETVVEPAESSDSLEEDE